MGLAPPLGAGDPGGVETLNRSVGSLARVERIGRCACALRALPPLRKSGSWLSGAVRQGDPVLLSLLWRVSDRGSQREVNFSSNIT